MPEVPDAAVPRCRRRWWYELLLAAALYGVYDLIRGTIADDAGWADQDGHDLLHWEQLTHLDPERWLNQALQHSAPLSVAACYFYATFHFLITPAVLIWCYRARPEGYGRARTKLALVTLFALIGFRWFPTAPPRLLPGGDFVDTLSRYRNWGWWGGDASVPAGAHELANQFAAMPSLHLAWAAWCGATIWTLTSRPAVRALAACYPLATALVVLATGNHYLSDVLAGALLWLVVHLSVEQLWRRARPRVADPARPNTAVW